MSSRLRTTLLLLAVAFAVFAATTVVAEPAQPTAQSTKPIAQQSPSAQTPVDIRRVECVVQGTPVEFPDDLYIRNTGNALLPKGWVVTWSVPNTSRKGTYTLLADLPAGGGVFASGQLPGGHAAGVKADCSCAAAAFSPALAPRVTRTKKPVTAVLANLGCVVQGTPVEFPDDIVITNKGTATIAKGKTLHWEIPHTVRKGDYVLTEDLLGGKSVFVSGVVGGGHPAGAACTVVVK